MNKFLAYYSLVVVSLGAVLCIFGGTGDGFVGGIIFIPIVYFLFTLVIDIAKSEDKDVV